MHIEYFENRRKYIYRPVVTWIRIALAFVNWKNLGCFRLVRKFSSEYTFIYEGGYAWDNV